MTCALCKCDSCHISNGPDCQRFQLAREKAALVNELARLPHLPASEGEVVKLRHQNALLLKVAEAAKSYCGDCINSFDEDICSSGIQGCAEFELCDALKAWEEGR